MKIIQTNDIELLKEIKKAIIERQGHCPCAIDYNDDTICMCKAFREQLEAGPCFCGRYIKIEE